MRNSSIIIVEKTYWGDFRGDGIILIQKQDMLAIMSLYSATSQRKDRI